jgi:malate dehydrogenase
MTTNALRVAVTGAAGNIAYSILWQLASGACFGPKTPIILHLLEITPVMDKLAGVVMELEDSAPPLLQGIIATDDAKLAFDGANAVFLVGGRPRTGDMNRSDLIRANGPIFTGQGQALNATAAKDVRILTVGNPCNTNCLIAQRSARDIPPERFTAMTRLDHNRATGQLAAKAGVTFGRVDGVAVWGNHSDRMYPDVSRAHIEGKPVVGMLDQEWLRNGFINAVAGRGKAIIKARGASSAASAASSAVDHMRDWFQGSDGRTVSMAVPSKGWYGVPEGLICSFPCTTTAGGNFQVIEGWELDDFGKQKLKENIDELESEKAAVKDLLG